MARIHETAVKWINDRLQNKPTINKKVNVAGGSISKVSELDTDIKQCPYCHKIFINPSFALKHTLKRHPDQLLLLHRKAINKTQTDVDLNPQSNLVNYLKSEFSTLKTELEIVKKVVANQTNDGWVKNQPTSPIHFQKYKGAGDGPDMHVMNSFGDSLRNKQEDAVSRDDFVKLQVKVEEISEKYKEALLVKPDKKVALNEDKLYKRLKKELLSEFQVSFQMNNAEYEEHFYRFSKDLQRLEEAVERNSKKIESPEALKKIDKKLEQQIENFYANYGVFDGIHKTSVKSNKGVSNKKSVSVHRSNRRKKHIYTHNSQGLNLINGPQLRTSDLNTSAGALKIPADSNSILKEGHKSNQKLDINKAKVIFEDKLKDINLSPNAKQVSMEEYETKMHLLQAKKELLCQKYSNFTQIYEKVNSQANELAKCRMRSKAKKQIRFSESPTFQSSPKEKVLAEQSSFEKKKDPVVTPEIMCDFGAAGDCGISQDEWNYHEKVMALKSSDVSDMSSEISEVESIKRSKPSTQNVPSCNTITQHKLRDMPDKALSPIPSVEEFSELSSLESYSNFSQNEDENP